MCQKILSGETVIKRNNSMQGNNRARKVLTTKTLRWKDKVGIVLIQVSS